MDRTVHAFFFMGPAKLVKYMAGKGEGKMKKYTLAGNLWFYYRKLFGCFPEMAVRTVCYIGCSVLLPLFSIYLPKLLLDLVEKRVSPAVLAAGIGGFVLAAAALNGIGGWAREGGYFMMLHTRERLMYDVFRKFLRTEYRFTEDSDYRGKYFAALQCNYGGDWSVSQRFYDTLPDLIVHALCFVLYSAVIGYLHPAILVLLVSISAVHYVLGERERRYKESVRGQEDNLDRWRQVLESCSQNRKGAKDLRIFGLEGWLADRAQKVIAEEKKLGLIIRKKESLRENAVAAMDAVRDFAAYAWLAGAVAKGQIGAGDFVLCIGAVRGFGDFLNQMIAGIQLLLVTSDRAAHYREYCALPDEEPEDGPQTGNRQEASAGEEARPQALSIDFCDVSFGYREGEDVLRHFSLHIAPGERVALVGENGVGKSTFVKLLTGLYEPREGTIRIGGRDAKEMSKGERYRLFSAVFQENRIFPFTVLENLTLRPSQCADRERAKWALGKAGLWEVFERKGISLDSYMTKELLREGVELSGGQLQRFMLARALYYDRPVLVLDEPTAALDPIAEREVYEAYAKITEKKTAVFISHRLASTRFSDRIVLLEGGKVTECGTHEELLAQGKHYAKMFALQASYYRDSEKPLGKGEEKGDER